MSKCIIKGRLIGTKKKVVKEVKDSSKNIDLLIDYINFKTKYNRIYK